ncbi:pentapeptide repeat-containing protein [Streptomyces sp. Vc74B-19]|uniref:pentapeptide repeat-containing protein n=1 Tax=Streptomyces sp. Vc74B-19 TaxID=2741324 RepID=UPI00203ABA75|nr:pentapeptide repeat-containing protein [Streptomyces sp. Vc74B-19]
MQMWKMRGRRRDRMWDVRLVLALAFVTALLVAAAVFYLGWGVLGVDKVKKEKAIDASTLFDLVKLAFGVVAGAGALVALIVAYRRQRIDEDGALREQTRLHTERFTTAVTQLGDDSAAVKLGGVHALAGLADDAPTPELQQTCVDVLCAFLRLPYRAGSDIPHDDEAGGHNYLALREVRHTVIRLIRDHLSLPDTHPHTWRGRDLDFTGVVFDGGDFSGVQFSSCIVRFNGATFKSGNVRFEDVTFRNCEVHFDGAHFAGGMVSFGGSCVQSAALSFANADFHGGEVSFRSVAIFSDSYLYFHSAMFEGTAISFRGLLLRESANLLFDDAEFSRGEVDFRAASFDGTASFRSALFAGDPNTVNMRGVRLLGGTTDFTGAYFAPNVLQWRDVRYMGGCVDFTAASGPPPEGLLTVALPDTVTLPAEWRTPDS